jgi:putative nucleotidyltransferase with HDIG domain
MGLYNRLMASTEDKFELLEKLWARMKSDDQENQLVSRIMQTAQAALNASAASLLLLDDRNQKLYFKYANGPAATELKRLHISRQSGIAGWIVRNGKPLLVNDAEKNRNFYKNIDLATGFRTKSIVGVPILTDDKVVGVIEVLNKSDGKPFTRADLNIMTEVAGTMALALETARSNNDLRESFKGAMAAVVSLADAREIAGQGHSKRVAEYALKAADQLGFSKAARQDLEFAALLHDIGKLTMPDRLLNKAEKLTDQEWDRIKRHPVIGYKLFNDIPILKGTAKLILHHHERYDGRGYPEGLQGENIPLGSRLLAVADAYDYMTTGHAHREALNKTKAITELFQNARTQFCPVAVKALSIGLQDQPRQ